MTTTYERPVRGPRISIVIPALNEARNLQVVLPQLPPVHEVIVVDGASTDGTAETARRVMPSVRLVKQTRRGKGNALACGFHAASGDVVVMFDADGSADPAEISSFVQTLVGGADFAKGSRVLADGGSEDITRLRAWGNTVLTALTNLMFGTRYTDLCYGYNAFWRDLLERLDLPSPACPERQWGDGFEIETVLNCRVALAGLAVREVASIERSRIHGVSNLNATRDGMRVLKTIVTERWGARSPRSRHRGAAGLARASASGRPGTGASVIALPPPRPPTGDGRPFAASDAAGGAQTAVDFGT